ncbi:MAG: glycosyltransferase family 2 protein [Cytophagales bacterium]|nr:MAG: glycosyltransferase family 2 protein [Cytophagales bacterium]
MELLFWIAVSIVLFTFLGYGLVISVLAALGKKKINYPQLDDEDLPEVTLIVACYNEEEILRDKVANCLNLDYPKERLTVLFVTDGSIDGSVELLQSYSGVEVSHSNARKGKIAAINRIMPGITTPISIFTDANVMLNPEAIRALVHPFQSNLVAAVSGEKVVLSQSKDGASSSGEGFYWKYESFLKRKDAQWNTLVGSAGELLAIRTHQYHAPEEDTVIEDFVITVRLAAQGYQVGYTPEAMAVETGSANIEEEQKRKVRISAGGLQAISRLPEAWNWRKHPGLTFQYLSHRVLRWTAMPVALVIAIFTNLFLADQHWFYGFAALGQLIFYGLASLGYLMRNRAIRVKFLHIPFYFVFMHVCVVLGWIRYFRGKQAVTWEKAQRASPTWVVQD